MAVLEDREGVDRRELKESLKRVELPAAGRLRELPKDWSCDTVSERWSTFTSKTCSQPDWFVNVLEIGFSLEKCYVPKGGSRESTNSTTITTTTTTTIIAIIVFPQFK